MSRTEFQPAWLNDLRLAAHALSPTPVWLWSADASRILWANPVAAAIFDAGSSGELAQHDFDSQHVSAAQILRLAGTLPQGGAPRLERLRGFGASFGGTLTCLCSRIALHDNSTAILVVSTERAGKDLSLPERARRLLADYTEPAAIFSADGELIEATAVAQERFGLHRDLTALGAETLAGKASRNGHAKGNIASGRITMLRLGAGATVALLVTFDEATNTSYDSAPSASHASARASDAAAAIAASAMLNRAVTDPSPRKFPFRFVWQMDAATRLTLGNDEFAKLIGPNSAALLNRPWAEIADTLKLDLSGEIARALASRDTWSGIIVHWPVGESGERLAVEMSGLPVFDRNRQFEGFRGFGICRNVERVAELDHASNSAPIEPASNEPTANVLTFRQAPPPAPVEPEPTPELSPGEHSAFEELARELNARLKKSIGKNTAAPTPDDFDVEPEPFIAPEPPKAEQPKEQPKSARDGDAAIARHGRTAAGRLFHELQA